LEKDQLITMFVASIFIPKYYGGNAKIMIIFVHDSWCGSWRGNFGVLPSNDWLRNFL